MNDTVLKKLGLAVLETECAAVDALKSRVDDDFVRACHFMLECEGRVVVIGMGKSGHVGGKIAATLASTGTPAFFVHPGEASHGDLGMITSKDVVLALSNSGETDEILTILPIIKRLHVPLISLTGNPNSTLARAASVNIHVGVQKEACPLDLAPTASTTAALAMGDALAISLLEVRGFTADDFARSHPGGKLGRRLLLLIDDLLHPLGERIVPVHLRLRVGEHETGTGDVGHEVDRGALEILGTLRIDEDLEGVLIDDDVLVRALPLHDQRQLVPELVATEAVGDHPHAEARRFAHVHVLAHFLSRGLGEGDHCSPLSQPSRGGAPILSNN